MKPKKYMVSLERARESGLHVLMYNEIIVFENANYSTLFYQINFTCFQIVLNDESFLVAAGYS